jgi:hypothetical protein
MTKFETLKDVVRDLLQTGSKDARTRFGNSVVPVYGATINNQPEHLGSAILMELSEGRFVLTAAHVLDHGDTATLYLGAPSAGKLVAIVADAHVTVAPGDNRHEDRADFALIKVDPTLAVALAKEKFIVEDQISRSVSDPSKRTYTCLGFPNSKNRVTGYRGKSITPKVGIYTSAGRSPEMLPERADGEYHLLVDHNQKWSCDDAGNRVNSISLPGFSGGAIIDLGELGDPNCLETPCEPKLAALLIEGHPSEKVILGVRISKIIEVLRKDGRL